MTRVNCVDPTELTNPHLIVEVKEITRIYRLAWAAYKRGDSTLNMPTTYRLGKGHVRFFYSRLGYISERHKALCDEMARRKYIVSLKKRHPWARVIDGEIVTLDSFPKTWKRNWIPTPEAILLNRDRLRESMERINSWYT